MSTLCTTIYSNDHTFMVAVIDDLSEEALRERFGLPDAEYEVFDSEEGVRIHQFIDESNYEAESITVVEMT